jgi:ABC-type transport system substrate-binding protein
MRRGAVLLAVVVLGSCTGGSPPPPPPVEPSGPAIYRTAIEDFGFTNGFDPVGEYSKLAWGLYSQLLLRTLVTFRHVSGDAGRELVPDVATDTGEVSDHGLTWTFHLKDGIRFGPPIGREVTSRDIEYAFRRIDTDRLVAQYHFYYDGLVVGMNGPLDRMPRDISGIDSSDPRVIVFHLRRPAGDFPMRLALPATAPVPPEVAGCIDRLLHHDRRIGYGNQLVATGPYMLRGEDALDVSSCHPRQRIEGLDTRRRLVLVRNPEYDPATDDPSVRESVLDGIRISIDTNTDAIIRDVALGKVDGYSAIYGVPSTEFLARVRALQGVGVHLDATDRLWYLVLNVLWPPFDDRHARRAATFVIDRNRILERAGGAAFGTVAQGIFPTGAGRPNEAPDIERARAEMRRSVHDTNGDGRCDGRRSCRVFTIAPTLAPRTLMLPVVLNELRALGIRVMPREFDGPPGFIEPYEPIFVTNTGLLDYPDPYALAGLLESKGTCPAMRNLAQVGLTAERAVACGSVSDAFKQRRTPPLNLDQEIDVCERARGSARDMCWEGFARTVQRLAPWIALVWANTVTLTGPNVARYEFDQFTGMISLAHVRLGG